MGETSNGHPRKRSINVVMKDCSEMNMDCVETVQ